MKQALTWVIAILIFVVPSNLFLKLAVADAYIQGILVDYLITKLYLSDIVIAIFLALAIKQYGLPSVQVLLKTLQTKLVFGLGALLLGIQVFSPAPWIGLLFYFSLLKILATFYYLKKCTFVQKSVRIQFAFIGTVLFQSLLGLYQYVNEQSLFGYWFLGEPELSYSLGLAREQVGTVEKLLAYGTTAHPNILGGVLSIYLLIILTHFKKLKKYAKWQQLLYVLSIVVGVIGLLTTHSISAWLAFFIGVICLVLTRYKPTIPTSIVIGTFCLFTLVSPYLFQQLANYTLLSPSTSITRRSYLFDAATAMFLSQPITGVGLNQFTTQLHTYTTTSEVIRFIQPVHNVLMLWLAETGLVGLAVLLVATTILVRQKVTSSVLILAVLPIMLLDHYLLSLQTGQLLMLLGGVFLYFSSYPKDTMASSPK